jgi:hypothetical protein
MSCAALSAVAIGGIVAGQIYAALRPNAYAWPFTSYPMFSANISPGDVTIFRAQLKYSNGVHVWWEPRHYKDKEQLSHVFAKALLNSKNREEFLERSRQIIVRYIARDLGSDGDAKLEFPVKITILRRQIRICDKNISISEQLVYMTTILDSRGG